MTLGEILPSVNAALNATSAVLLLLARAAIKRKDVERHKRLMLAALGVSALFLVCYLVRVALTGTHRYQGPPLLRAIYLVVLFSHMSLAAATPFLALRALQLALRRRFDEHRRIVRWAFPIWMYVSVTGVVVYWMLYHPLP